MKNILVLALLLLAGCQSEQTNFIPPKYSISGTVPGFTNSYLKDGIYPWHSNETNADLIVKTKREDGFPKKLISTSINENEYIETYIYKYKIIEVAKGETKETSLSFLAPIHWDKRHEYKRAWPYGIDLVFHLNSSDYQIVNVKRSALK